MTTQEGKKAANPGVKPTGKANKKGGRRTRRGRPFFRTMSGRVRTTVAVAVLGTALVAAYALADLYAADIEDAYAGNERLLAAVASGQASFVEDIRGALHELSNAAAVSADTVAVCERMAVDAASMFPAARIGVASAAGTVLCEAGVGRDSATIGETTFFARAAASKGFGIGDATDGPSGRIVGFAHASGGAVAFAVVPEARLAFPDAGLPREGDAMLFDAKGASVTVTTEDGTGGAVPAALAAEAQSRQRGSAVLETGGAPRLYSFADIGGGPGARLYAAVGVPASAAFAEARLAVIRTLSLGLVLLLAAAWFAMVIGDLLIARRIRRLAHSMREYVAGDADAARGISRGLGEMDGITDMFERLVAKVQEAQRTVEERVRSRTSMLEVTKGMTELEKARMEALLGSVADGIVATDGEGKVSFVNDVAKSALWWEAEGVEGVPVYQAFKLENDDESPVSQEDWPYHGTLRTGKKTVTPAPAKPLHIRRRDKTRFPVVMTVTPVLLGGDVIGTLILFRDITDEVEFDRRKSEFISIASHQLRSPISALKWLTDMLRKGDVGPLSEKQTEWVDKIFISAEKMNLLVNELLNVSRMESGVTQLNIVPTDAGKFVKEALTETEALLAEKKQTFAYEPAELPEVPMDMLMMGEVLKNFISNASKYSPEGSAIGIRATVDDGMFLVAVKDQGIGIPKADQNQMFNKFFRAQNAVQSPIKGTGLGLYMAKSTVELHGGVIGFDSEGEGKGSTFWFRIPVRHDTPPPGAVPSPAHDDK